jgi:hypothetical protein
VSFSGAESRSGEYQKFLADGLTRSLVAAKAREMSARTGGYILLLLLFDLSRPGGAADRELIRIGSGFEASLGFGYCWTAGWGASLSGENRR